VQFLHAVRPAALMYQQSLHAGDVVFARSQRWRVVSTRPYAACNIVALAGACAANAGLTTQVVTPFEDVAVAAGPRLMRLVGARRWRRRCRELLASQGPADRLRTALHARIELLPHQLEPALAIMRGLTCRVLIADEVGLGKTIQAGLIASELRERGMADRILVLTPAGLREQWADELKRRFDLDPALMDAVGVRRRSSMLMAGVNPWPTVPLAIASLDYIKRPEVQPGLTSCRWDLVIVDEVHGVGPGSDRLAAVGAICGRASYVVLLTATPHSGNRLAFDSLRSIGAHPNDRLLTFRRTRQQVGLTAGRRVHRVLVEPSRPERAMHAALTDLARAMAREPESSRDAWLTLAVLQKRALSSATALARTVARRLKPMESDNPGAECQLLLPLGDIGERDPADEAPGHLSSVLRDAHAERRLLRIVEGRAAAAAAHETKPAYLDRLLRRLGRRREQAIVFTEYRDTLLHLRRHLSADCAILHGGLTRDERRLQLDRFVTGRCPVLLATDAAGEGLNLHERCRTVINLELPWNPMRLEQRIGRVDRIGQKQRVHAFHLISRGTGEVRILAHLISKLTRARTDISVSDPLGWSDATTDDGDLAAAIAGIECRNRAPLAVSHEPAEEMEPGTFGHLEVEAATELQRLLTARQLSAIDTHPAFAPREDCFATVARRTPTRAQLRGRLLALVHTELTDAVGRSIAVRVVPLLLAPRQFAKTGRLRRHLRAIAAAIEAFATQIDQDRWRQANGEMHRAFLAARKQRDSAILADLERRPSSVVQAGLFDRRALRELADDAASQAEMRADLERSCAGGGTAAHTTPRVALMMADRW
jgi:superfamily II DNA or RNA helicase